jgi:electron transport complex protein RnfB
MDVNALLISMGSMGGLGAFFALGLIIANIKLHVDEDPRNIMVLEELPGANCGGCGYPGCGAFAERIVDGSASITACPVNTADGVAEIARIMGVEAEVGEKMFARVLCLGGNDETAKKGEYLGIRTCMGAHLTFGAEKLCQYGCLGFSDCVRSCPFDAIKMNDNGLPVVDEEKCTGCGNCEIACPRDIIEIHPSSRNLFVFCRNKDEAKYSRTVCIKACTACKACVKAVDEGQIVMANNLAVIDYETYGTVPEIPTQKCPNGVIDLITDVYSKQAEH